MTPLSCLVAVLVSAAPAPSANTGEAASACVAAHRGVQLQRRAGRLLEARRLAAECLRAGCPQLVAADCADWASQLEKSVPSVVIAAVSPQGSDVSAVRVWVDEQLVATRLSGTALEIDPGEHDLKFELEGTEPVKLRVMIREGELARPLSVTFVALPATTASTAVVHEPDPAVATTEAPARSVSPGVWGLAALAVAGVGTFTGFGLSGNSARAQLDRLGCAPNCSSADVNVVRTRFLVADVALGVALVAAVAAVVWFFASR